MKPAGRLVHPFKALLPHRSSRPRRGGAAHPPRGGEDRPQEKGGRLCAWNSCDMADWLRPRGPSSQTPDLKLSGGSHWPQVTGQVKNRVRLRVPSSSGAQGFHDLFSFAP